MTPEPEGGRVVDRRAQVGVGCLVFQGARLLMTRRRGVHGKGSWSPPGGGLAFGESFEECARREVREETGVEIAGAPAYVATTNDVFVEERRHYVTVWMIGHWACGEPVNAAPYELDAVAWVPTDQLPVPLFAPFARLLGALSTRDQHHALCADVAGRLPAVSCEPRMASPGAS